MDVFWKKRWLANLLSGEFEQGMSKLRTNDNKYCCLGVLCSTVGVTWEKRANQYNIYLDEYVAVYNNAQSSTSLPEVLMQDLDIPLDHHNELANMNDSGKSFKEIAEYIDKNM